MAQLASTVITGSLLTTLNVSASTAQFDTITGDLIGTADTASYTVQAVSSSHAISASWAPSAATSSVAISASYASQSFQAVSSSFSLTTYVYNIDGGHAPTIYGGLSNPSVGGGGAAG